MSDTTSRGQSREPPPGEGPRDGSTDAFRQPVANGASPLAEDQPTVISNRPPLPTLPRLKSDQEGKPGDIPPGARLGHYELLEYVGGGGMGHVFRALDTRLGRSAALKVLPRDQAGNLDTLMRFRNEARSAARLNHEGIAQVYYVGEDEGMPFIAFEFVEGVNIRDLVAQKGPLPLAEAVSYTLQVAEALVHAASRKVVHRDIKPSNVLITSEGKAKLIDMGLARMPKTSVSAKDLTASGVTLGTFDYISPEQARDPRNADSRSDIYSLGCTLFFMLTGRPPFPEGTVLQKLLQHQGIEPPDVRQFRPGLPEEVSRVLRKMMVKEPRRRYQDPSKLVEALLSLADGIGLRPLGPGHTAWTAAEEPKVSLLQRHVPWMGPVAALVVIVMLLQVLWSSSAQEAGQSPSSWIGPPAEFVKEPSSSDESMRPSGVGPEGERPPGDAARPPADGTGTAESTAPSAGPKQVAVSPEEPVPAPASNGGALSPRGKDVVAEVGLTKPNPVDAMVSNRGTPNGLFPEAFAGGVLPPGPNPSGLSVGSQVGAREGEVGGAAGTATGPALPGPLAEPVPERHEILIVGPDGESRRGLASLSAACAAARHGDVVELHYSGRLEEEPLELANMELTIRAGKGFQPVVGFQPSAIDPIGYPRSMFTLIGSRLTLIDVAVELDMPREVPTDRWSLFEIGQGERVRLENCWLTIRNASDRRAAYHQEVTFFRLKAAPGTQGVIRDEPRDGPQRVAIELADCVVRGEAVFLRTEDLRPVELGWRNGLLITTEQLLVADGGERAPLPSEAIQIDLRNLTAVADGGLCRLHHSEFAPYQLPLRVRCADSVLMLTPEAPLIEQVGVTDMEQSRQRIAWVGERNVYHGVTSFWTVRHLDPKISSEVYTFDDWKWCWGLNEQSPRLGLTDENRLPAPDRPVHLLTPDDYPPEEATTNAVSPTAAEPAAAEAGKREDAGFRAERLRGSSPESAPEETLKTPPRE